MRTKQKSISESVFFLPQANCEFNTSNMSDTEQAQAPVASTSTQPKTLSTEGQANRIRPWKAARTGGSTARVQQSKRLSRKWADRQEERKRDDAVKQLER